MVAGSENRYAKIDGHVLVARNERDMQGMGVEVLNPFSR